MKNKVYIIIITIAFLLYTPFFAAAYQSTEFVVKSNISENNKIKASIFIPKNSNISALSMELEYNSDQLKIADVVEEELSENGIVKINYDKKNRIIITYISTSPLEESGNFVSINFTIIENFTDKILPIKLVVTEAVTGKYKKLDVNVKQAEILNPNFKENLNNITTTINTVNDEKKDENINNSNANTTSKNAEEIKADNSQNADNSKKEILTDDNGKTINNSNADNFAEDDKSLEEENGHNVKNPKSDKSIKISISIIIITCIIITALFIMKILMKKRGERK